MNLLMLISGAENSSKQMTEPHQTKQTMSATCNYVWNVATRNRDRNYLQSLQRYKSASHGSTLQA